jgi:LacI family transcriptional regulator
MVIGVVMPSLQYAYFAGTLELLQTLLAREGYTLLLSSSNNNPQQELDGVKAMMAQGVDGVILFGRPLNDESTPLLARRGVPHLRCWAALPGERSIAFDHGAAMSDVVDHLVALGHRDIAVVIPFIALGDRMRGRLTSIREALARHGLALPKHAIVQDGGMDAAAGREAVKTLRGRQCSATAIICSNDLIAAGVILEYQSMGFKVPQDISVTGYNDSALARAFEPSITSVETPLDLHAQEVAKAMVSALNNSVEFPNLVLPTRLKIRNSTGRVKPH